MLTNKELEKEGQEKREEAVATFLGIKKQEISSIFFYENQVAALITIPFKNSKKFVDEFTPPFKVGDKVIPTSTIRPRGGKKEDELTDNRKRTVKKVEFDLNTRSWWIWVKGNRFPFNPKLFRLVSPR